MNPTRLTDQIKEALAKQSFTSVAEAQALVDSLTKKHNRAPLDDFDSLSPEQMARFLYAPYSSPDLVEFASDLILQPTGAAITLFGIIADAIGDKGIAATATGNLPVNLVRKAAQTAAGEPGDNEVTPPSSIRSETDYSDLHAVRLTAELGKLIRKYKGRFLLSAECRGILTRQGLAGFYPRLLRTYATEFDWGYRDLYPDLFIIQRSFLFTLWLLDRYGAEWRPNTFYENLFLKAFPQALAEANSDLDDLPEQTVRRCYSLRCLDRFAGFFGLAEIDLSPDDSLRSNFQVRKTSLLNDVVRFPASGK